MGPRNLTAVYLDGEYKIAQYGQWDGYPEGQGLTCLRFLKNVMDESKFKAALRNLCWIDNEELRDMWKHAGADDDGMISIYDATIFGKKHQEFSRDTGAEILELVQNGKVGNRMQNSIEFAADSLFCEWAWVIDFDERTFGGYAGFNRTALTEKDRFYFLRDIEDNEYHAVRLINQWSLDNLPSEEEFLDAFKEED